MLLKDKVAVIYGAGGAMGAASARAFASEGASVFLTGHSLAGVEGVAKEILAAGGIAEAAQVDATDEQAIDEHLNSVMDKAGRVDISFNTIGIPNAKIVGKPLTELDLEYFDLALTTYTNSYFLTARHAARRMIPNKSGVIMTVTALHSRIGVPFVGGYGPAQAAKEALTRHLSVELAPHGIRANYFNADFVDTPLMRKLIEDRARMKGVSVEAQTDAYKRRNLLGVGPIPPEAVAEAALFLASPRAAYTTGAVLTIDGGLPDAMPR